MSIRKTIGGDRLGSGKKMTVDLRTYERSTHDLSYIWRSTMAAGTLVPFMSEVALPGDTFDINLDCDVKTHPTIGPLFGSYKVQLDVFQVPVRLYQGQLHNNKLGIGMEMAKVKLPQLVIKAPSPAVSKPDIDNVQINPSSIFSYINIRGIGVHPDTPGIILSREFNAVPYLAYWDIYKNYYANKQEEKGAVIHNEPDNFVSAMLYTDAEDTEGIPYGKTTIPFDMDARDFDEIVVKCNLGTEFEPESIILWINNEAVRLDKIYTSWFKRGDIGGETIWVSATRVTPHGRITTNGWQYASEIWGTKPPEIKLFPLENIDKMREDVLANTHSAALLINDTSIEPYSLPLKNKDNQWAKSFAQEGLALKTYQSDLFNNWMSTEWIDGDNGIAAITAVDTSDGNFTIDTLNLSKKVYDMLNRIAISGGSYDDWLEAVYTHERIRRAESPIYMGGLIRELVFQEVVSNAEAGTAGDEQPLGTIAGKGVMGHKKKGGIVNIKVDEPSYIMGIISLTPRVDYSQGNKWDMNLKTMDDFHKPALDEIGFQDLITDQMAWFDTTAYPDGTTTFKSAGKQPAWINYMTNVNQVRGNFAIESNEMFMTLNRKYEKGASGIKDLTTYIDPVKFNHIFAQTSRDAQNFWTQIAVDITARRKMSAKIMPNL